MVSSAIVIVVLLWSQMLREQLSSIVEGVTNGAFESSMGTPLLTFCLYLLMLLFGVIRKEFQGNFFSQRLDSAVVLLLKVASLVTLAHGSEDPYVVFVRLFYLLFSRCSGPLWFI